MPTVNETGKKAVILFSGGMDSATLLHTMYQGGYQVYPLSIYYGQRHQRELAFAREFTQELGVVHEVVRLPELQYILRGSALTSDNIKVPQGHYEHESMKATVVPNRNMILMSIAGGYAVSIKADILALAVHAGDHAIYPDCTPQFITAFGKALYRGNDHSVYTHTPFLHLRKEDIAEIGLRAGLDYSKTWSCYEGGYLPCGKCGTCVERAEALEIANQRIKDDVAV